MTQASSSVTVGHPGSDGTVESDVVLRAEHISVEYDGVVPTRAVRDVSLELKRGEILGIAGESGCGKSTLVYGISRLLRPPARLAGGDVTFYGREGGAPIDVMALRSNDLRRFRWEKMSMVFQSAMNSLNPVVSLRKQFDDIFETHVPDMDSAARLARSQDLLGMVGIDPSRIRAYPHELSGGMRQRVAIAMALALEPEIIIMDEPTTALDVVVQREILDQVRALQAEFGFSIIFVTHDLSLLLEISDHLAVMYAGRIVEYAPSVPAADAPAHPYTYGLLRSFPDMLGDRRALTGIPGTPPDLRDAIPGCAFMDRCQFAFEACADQLPVLQPPVHRPNLGETAADWRVACHLHDAQVHPEGPPSELRVGMEEADLSTPADLPPESASHKIDGETLQ